jgi:hypothetical protein
MVRLAPIASPAASLGRCLTERDHRGDHLLGLGVGQQERRSDDGDPQTAGSRPNPRIMLTP